MAILAWPMVLLGTVWITLGHVFLAGGEGGWMILFNIVVMGPGAAIALLIHAILVTLYARKVGRWQAGPWSGRFALAFYILLAVHPFLIEDVGDSGPGIPSRLMVWFGISSEATEMLMGASILLLLAVAVALIVVDAIDLGKAFRMMRPVPTVLQP